jgi:hypothetical protein
MQVFLLALTAAPTIFDYDENRKWYTPLFSSLKRKTTAIANIPEKRVSLGKYSDFVPAPLPPKPDWTPAFFECSPTQTA